MNTLEDRLRDAFRADADTVRPESIPPGPPPRPARPSRSTPGQPWLRRTRVLIPLAAAAAVIAVVAGLSLAAPQRSGSRPTTGSSAPVPGLSGPPTGQPPTPAGPPPKPILAANASRGVPASTPAPGVPRFYVTAYVNPQNGVDSIVVRDTATGQVTGRINPPGSAVFAGLAATAGERTFITTIQTGTACSPVQLYEFGLNQRGQPGPLEPLHITLPGGVPQGQGDLAITPDGRTIAYESGLCRAHPDENEVGVINLATRQARVWADPVSLAKEVALPNIDVSLSADGGLLGYATFDGAGVLPTSAPAGSLYARSRPVSGTVIWAAIAGDGHSLYGCSVSPFHSGGLLPKTGTLTYSQISLTRGLEHVIARWTHVGGPQCYASLDPAGNYLLVAFPAGASRTYSWTIPAILNLRTGQLTMINGAGGSYWLFDMAW
jgi:hypothetical protein